MNFDFDILKVDCVDILLVPTCIVDIKRSSTSCFFSRETRSSKYNTRSTPVELKLNKLL